MQVKWKNLEASNHCHSLKTNKRTQSSNAITTEWKSRKQTQQTKKIKTNPIHSEQIQYQKTNTPALPTNQLALIIIYIPHSQHSSQT